MQLEGRIKSSAEIVGGALSISMSGLAGYNALTSSEEVGYLLESTDGKWEYGVLSWDTVGSAWIRTIHAASNPQFTANENNLVFSVIALPTAYVAVHSGTTPPKTHSANALAIGSGATANTSKSVVIGCGASDGTDPDISSSTLLGYHAGATISGIAIGENSAASLAGEVSFGSCTNNGVSFLPVVIESTTISPAQFKSVENNGAYYGIEYSQLIEYAIKPTRGSVGAYAIRVTGTIFARTDDYTSTAWFNIDYATKGSDPIYNATSIVSSTGTAVFMFGVSANGVPELSASGIGVSSFLASGVFTVHRIPLY